MLTMKFPMILWWKVSSAPVASILKDQGEQCPPLRASLRVTEKYTSIINILNAVAHLQLEVCKSSQDLFKHLTNKNHRNYLHNHIKSISPRRLSNHQRSNNFLNISGKWLHLPRPQHFEGVNWGWNVT